MMSPSPVLRGWPGTLCTQAVFEPLGRALRRSGVFAPVRSQPRLRQQKGCDARRIPEIWIGFSLGCLRLLAAIEAGASPAGLVLIAGNAEAASRMARLRSRQIWQRWHRQGAARVADSLTRRELPRRRQQAAARQQVLHMARQTARRDLRDQLKFAASRPARHAVLTAYRGPVLLIHGERDRVVPLITQQRLLGACPQARLERLPGAGHYGLLDSPVLMARTLAAWLRQNFPGDTPC